MKNPQRGLGGEIEVMEMVGGLGYILSHKKALSITPGPSVKSPGDTKLYVWE